jgi:hypothetical protein
VKENEAWLDPPGNDAEASLAGPFFLKECSLEKEETEAESATEAHRHGEIRGDRK